MDQRLAGQDSNCTASGHIAYFEINAYPSDPGITLYAHDITDTAAHRRGPAGERDAAATGQEAAGFGIWDWNLNAGTTVWSEQNWRLYGRNPDSDESPTADANGSAAKASPAIFGLAWIHRQDRARVIAAHDAVLGAVEPTLHVDFRVIWPDGTVHWLLSKGAVVRDADGNAVRMVGVNMDITASQETEAALRRLSLGLEQRVIEEVAAREAAQTRASQARTACRRWGSSPAASRMTSTMCCRRFRERSR